MCGKMLVMYLSIGETGIVSNFVPDRERCMLTYSCSHITKLTTRTMTDMNSLSVSGVFNTILRRFTKQII